MASCQVAKSEGEAVRYTDKNDARAALDRWLASLAAKRDGIERAIKAIRLLYKELDDIGPELATSMAESILHQQGYRVPAPTLFDLLSPETPAVSPLEQIPSNSPYEGKHRDRVTNYFLNNGNQPASNQEIREAVGLTRGAVAVVLYQEESDFENLGKDLKNKVLWRLNPHTYENKIRERSIDSNPPPGLDG